MFGQQDDQANNDQGHIQPVDDTQPSNDSQANDSMMPAPTFHPDSATPPADPVTDDAPADDQSWQHPGVPIDSPGPGVDVISPAGGFPRSTPMPTNDGVSSDTTPAPAANEDDKMHELLGIKQEALQKLMPMIDEIEQTPEEHFRTLMMMIQASDDDTLVPKAYEAANAIEDEHTRAQALLDIVNEINYFTQPQETQEHEA
jgi:hypothetical protein